ncbi:flagellar basal body-associated FliL family protein [Halarcobacter ebronensis]|uniref:Flagellar protein FliL n=1 Tax=Halarcobacter ebronensis TaxID=1462615 RepID=A0A4Q1AKR2_9BACT|nr:flagellar basal body-associated FliL family protein [Halarcobacter ebronensis]QKF83189.1 flagellar motor-associated protein FliL [Halarcobacter ebronensis]RXK05174.1 flagellar basal body protein FliL [Halarcobacter ebronensis]
MADENEEVTQKSSGKGLIVVLIVLVVLLFAAVGVGGYLLLSSGVLNGQQQLQNQNQTTTEKADAKDSYKASINDLVLNITNAKGREKLMKLSFAIKSTEPTIESLVEEYKPEIVDAVIAQVSSRSSEELLTVGGKALLKEELMDDINSILNEVSAENDDIQKNSIKQILFTSFVIK